MDLRKDVSQSYVLKPQANYAPYSYILCNPGRPILNASNQKSSEQTDLVCANNPVHLNTAIHINPNVFVSRNVRINKEVCSSVENNSSTSKTERIYYNPKFLQKRTSENNDSEVHKNKENKIHLNPHFIKRNPQNSDVPEIASASNLKSEGPCIMDKNQKLSTNGIHFNPKFLKSDMSNQIISKEVNSSSLFSNCETNTSKYVGKNKSKIKHISKYKLIRSKVSPSVSPVLKDFKDLSYTLKKANTSFTLKKTNTIIKRKSTYPYSLVRNNKFTHLSKYSVEKCVPGGTSKGPMEKSTLDKSTTASRRNSCSSFYAAGYVKARKSILQNQIEARRRGRRYSMSIRPSKYKYIKNNQETSPKKEPAPNSYRKHHYFNSEATTSRTESISKGPFSSVYKSMNRTKLVMKSILQSQIESRRLAKNSNFYFQRLFYKKFHQDLISKYKLIRSAKTSKKSEDSATIGSNLLQKVGGQIPKKNDEVIRKRLNAICSKYRIVKKKKLVMLTKKLKKNNQPCPFFGRFGRCKGKDKGTCPKLHDPKYITICKKHLRGECKDEPCLLSHDIRPEKMPTCHHYLSGLCKRSECPYLHIKVNQKSPICRFFLQGFCEDVFNCRKRHEYICPVFAEKGNCAKGKCCGFPHRTSVTQSKLLGPDQFPLLERRGGSRRKRLNNTPPDEVRIVENTDPLLSVRDKQQISTQTETDQTNPPPKPFSRYFLQPLSSQDTLNDHNIEHNSN